MGELFFKNKYRIPSSRLDGYDYSQNGNYFITICVHEKQHYFGEVVNGKMKLSPLGLVAQKCWQEIPGHFHHVCLDEFIIMPNHVHGIININHGLASRFGECHECCQWDKKRWGHFKNDAHCNTNIDVKKTSVDDIDGAMSVCGVTWDGGVASVETLQCNVSTPTNKTTHISTQTPTRQTSTLNTTNNAITTEFMSSISPKSGSLSTIVRSYKSAVTKTINGQCPYIKFQWQSRFYDHIIKNEIALHNIRAYIRNNPAKWWRDRNNHFGILM
ncbi:MAG: hypothetical protein WA057_02085 [Candidatus Magasanikiibacteriota bacterium]